MSNLTDILVKPVGSRDDQPILLGHLHTPPSGHASSHMALPHAKGNAFPEEEQQRRAWDIIQAYGRTSLARYALLNDKDFFFTTGGSVISYVVKNRVAVALGEPIGPEQDAAASISEFIHYCNTRHWLSAFYQVSASLIEIYEGFGFRSLQIGDEAIVDLSTFSLAGTANRTVRNRFNKMTRLGYECRLVQPPHSALLLHELASISSEWLIGRGGSELRLLGWFDESYLNTCPVMIVRNREGCVEAFANLVTEFQAAEIHVDLMRQGQRAESGLMDFLFVSLLEWAREAGYASFNLGLSPLAGVGENSNDPIIERVFHYIFCNAHFYNFRGLHSFKGKFHPTWSPRYLIYPSLASLPAVGLSVLRALNANLLNTLWGIVSLRNK